MTIAVFIDGAVGTTGLEIADRLAGREEFTPADARRGAAQIGRCPPRRLSQRRFRGAVPARRRGDRSGGAGRGREGADHRCLQRASRRARLVLRFSRGDRARGGGIGPAGGEPRLLSHRLHRPAGAAAARRAAAGGLALYRQRRLGLFGRRQGADRAPGSRSRHRLSRLWPGNGAQACAPRCSATPGRRG